MLLYSQMSGSCLEENHEKTKNNGDSRYDGSTCFWSFKCRLQQGE